MTKKLVFSFLIFLMILISLLVACVQQTSTSTVTSAIQQPTATSTQVQVSTLTSSTTTSINPVTTTTTPATSNTTQGNWWDEFGTPKYGGTIILRAASLSLTFDSWDWTGGNASGWMWHDTLFIPTWTTTDRDTFSFSTMWTPETYWQGLLANSWEWTDGQTLVVHLQQGVRWQNKAPMNGREFTADDVVYHYDRLMGVGSFTKGSPFYAGRFGGLQKATATDKYTVTFQFAASNVLINTWAMHEVMTQFFEAREAVEQGITDWTKALGTGPLLVTDYVDKTSLTYSKNSNYWGYDERYPQNRLPYADNVKVICIPDSSTALAALRTDKIDLMNNIDWRTAKTVQESNSTLLQAKIASPDWLIQMRTDTIPFKDIRVRKALQMAINRPGLAKDYYGGTVDGIPSGIISPLYKGYAYTYDQWPQSLKDEYAFNPSMSKQLLTEAGYPNGFNTDVVVDNAADLNLIQAIKSYFSDIGVQMDIRTMDTPSYTNFTRAGKEDAMAMPSQGGTAGLPPAMAITMWISSELNNLTMANDAYYDGLVTKFNNSSSADDTRNLLLQCDQYFIEHHWGVEVFTKATYAIWQPYVKSFQGENLGWGYGADVARWWINK
jgi:peptide/nickel transport system substrate-binding protein